MHFSIDYSSGLIVGDVDYTSVVPGTDIYINSVAFIKALATSLRTAAGPGKTIEEIIDYIPETQTLRMGVSVLKTDMSVIDLSLMTLYFSEGNASVFYNHDPEDDMNSTKRDSANGLREEITWTLHNIINHDGLQVSASFNPFSQYNIIGSLQEAFHGGPMLFPYDRNPEIVVRIIDQYGIPIQTKFAVGYVDLDLIIDNSSSYSIDA
jgi:hypothetical protein